MPRKRATNGAGMQPRQRKDGLWEARVIVGRDAITGKYIRKSVYGKTAAECSRNARKMTVKVDKGEYKEPCKMKLSEWCDIWLKDYTPNIKDSSRRNYQQNIENYIKPALGKIEIGKLEPHIVQGFITALQEKESEKTHKPLSAKTIKNVHGTLCKCLTEAERVSYIQRNPATKALLPRVQGKEINVLDSGELKRFTEAIIGEKSEDIFFIAVNTGMRLSEIVGLRWTRVDFAKNEITVDAQMLLDRGKDSPKGLGTPKGNRPRKFVTALSVMNRLRAIKHKQLEKQLAAGELWDNSLDLVFTNEIGQPILQRTVEKHFKRIMEKLLLADMGYTFHDLRHTFTVECIKAGVDVKTLSEMLGHKDVAFTLNVYGHVTNEMQLDAAARIENAIKERVQKA